jgi:hypothetical protein
VAAWGKEQNVIKKILLYGLVALILLALPLAIRWFYFYEGRYQAGEVPRPDLSAIRASAPEMTPFQDRFTAAAAGRILVDRAHDNRFTMADLSVLQARLAARGGQLEPVDAVEDLAGQLRHAQALVVISPGEDWAPAEIKQVQEFVDKGGRLLIVTDPTRYGIAFDEWDYPILDEDVRHINDLAAQFGLLFQADYLYNTTENEGNFRNIRLTDFGDGELTQGLEQVVFYAAHSIFSDEPALIVAGGETRSSGHERAEPLTVAVLSADGAVLALGDLTFMAEPYNVAYDNDRFIANIADFLAGAQREYDLNDFPLFFGDRVDLVYTGEPLLDSDLLPAGGELQALFADQDRELTVRQEEDGDSDTLFLGLYHETEEVEPYLTAAQVTLLITPTEITEEEPSTAPTPRPTVTPSPPVTGEITTTLEVTPTEEVEATPEVTSEPEITATVEVSPTALNRVRIESLGEMVLTGTSLLLLQTDGDRHVLVVLADTEMGLANAVERLIEGDLESCLLHETEPPTSTVGLPGLDAMGEGIVGVLALCPTGELGPGEGGGGWEEAEPELPPPVPTSPVTDTEAITDTEVTTETVESPEPTGEPQGSILIVALDEGEGRYDGMTGAEDYASILESRYEVTTWSNAEDGALDTLDVYDYDLIIWTAGDFEDPVGDEESNLLFLAMLEGIPVIVSGAYIGDTDNESVQRDIQVSDATHPLAEGFDLGEVIPFVSAPSGSEYETSVLEVGGEEEGTSIPFVRGPDSEDAGAPAIYVLDDEFSGMRIVLIGFPIYLLPEEAKAQLVLNMADWLTGLE